MGDGPVCVFPADGALEHTQHLLAAPTKSMCSFFEYTPRLPFSLFLYFALLVLFMSLIFNPLPLECNAKGLLVFLHREPVMGLIENIGVT